MYPVALYGSLPEIAYLAPRGSFAVHPAVEEEFTPRSDPPSRAAQARGEKREALARCISDD